MFGFKNYGNIDTRSGFGVGLVEAASKNKDIVALCADLTGSLKMNDFKNKYPNSCLLYTSPSPRDMTGSRMPSSA